MPDPINLHASCVSIDGKAVLLLGDSGSGKSDLALRLIDTGARLVGDDRVIITEHAEKLLAAPALHIEGMLEVRGIGIVQIPYVAQVPIALAVKLISTEEVDRIPEPQLFDCFDLQVPLLSLHAFHPSTPAKIRLFLAKKGITL